MRIRERLRSILTINESPRRLAFAFALGLFIAISPLIGLHTILGLGLSWLFRLNKFVTMLGVFVNNPWTLVPIYTFATWVGAILLGVDDIIPDIDWNNVNYKMFFDEFKPLLWPFIVGSTFVGLVSSVAAYFVIYIMIKRSRNEN
ncbi:MAG: DUF2062 domain-containing protein [Nitrospirae bacterium]|nr:DUF2062 domain-containing protein [Nitrospirota bacterium]